MKTLVFANQKGGVGKSAIASQLAFYMHCVLKLRVIVIDADHQGNTTRPLTQSGKLTVSATNAATLFRARISQIEDAPFVLIPSSVDLMDLERDSQNHNNFANNLNAFMGSIQDKFDVCLIDTNPNPDIRLIAAFAVGTHVLSPIELNQEAIDGINLLLKHKRVGIEKMQKTVNKDLVFLGILPNKVESTPFHKFNFIQLAESGYGQYLVRPDPNKTEFAYINLRSVVAEAQADGCPIWEVKQKGKDGLPARDAAGNLTGAIKTAGRDTWREIKPYFQLIVSKMNIGK